MNKSTEKLTKSEKIINRLKQGLGLKTDKSLCEKLNIGTTTLAGWKSRNSVVFDTIFTNCEDLSIHWLVTGEGPIRLDAKPEKQYEALNSKPLSNSKEADELDFNWKIGKIIENAPEEKSAKVLGDIDLLFRQYVNVKPDSSKQEGFNKISNKDQH